MRALPASFLAMLTGSGVLFAQLDANSNGMSDPWERHFNSGQLFGPGFTATGDQDGDGQENREEAVSGTDPLKYAPPEGHFIQTIRHVPATWGQEPGQNEPVLLTPEAFEIGWQAVAGKQYTLSCSPSLEGGSWLPVGDRIYTDVGGPILIGCIPDEVGGQMPDKFFWRVQAGDIDQDGDALNDYEENLVGTYYWIGETFPGIPDLWLATHYPTAGDFDPDGDDDSDGLTNFDEYLNGANPHNTDSDGDGTSDATEVNQGSNPSDNADGGMAPTDPLEEVPFTVGGDFAYWRMEIKGQGPRDTRLLRVASQFPGDTVTRALKLQRNNKYEITLHRVGGFPDWYCWEAGVAGQPIGPTFDAGPGWFQLGARNQNAQCFSVADHWLMDNRDGLLTGHLDSYFYDVASGLRAALFPVEVKIMKPDNWGVELEQQQVVLFEEEVRVRVRLPALCDTLAEALELPGFDRLILRTNGTSPEGREIAMNQQNTTLLSVAGHNDLQVCLTRTKLRDASVIPNAEQDTVHEIAWFDLVKDARSNLADSQAWEAANVGVPEKDKRGRAYNEGSLGFNGDRPIDKSFLVAGGAQVFTVEVGGTASEKRQLAEQSDVFYISGHGSYGTGTVSASGDGIQHFSAAEAKWHNDMEIVIVGGCSILGIRTKKFRYPSMSGGDQRTYDRNYGHVPDPSPGIAWEGVKPDIKLGYAFTAPLDTQGMPEIIAAYQALVNGGMDSDAAWGQANLGTKGVNACAIDTRATPHAYWFFKEVKTGWFSSELQWTRITKTVTGWE